MAAQHCQHHRMVLEFNDDTAGLFDPPLAEAKVGKERRRLGSHRRERVTGEAQRNLQLLLGAPPISRRDEDCPRTAHDRWRKQRDSRSAP